MESQTLLTAECLRQHASPQDCWLLINGVVWDFTDFAESHPGGVEIIHNHAGRDASEAYNSIHAPSLIDNQLGASKKIGQLDNATLPPDSEILMPPSNASVANSSTKPSRRSLQAMFSSHDFEQAASENMSAKAWAFFSSAATDCITRTANENSFDRIWLRPRIMRNVSAIKTTVKLFGREVNMPLFASPTAMAKLAHPNGELAIAKGCELLGVPQTISTNASFPIEEITASANIPFFFQLYVNKDRAASEVLLRQAEECGCLSVFVTVDQPTPGKREADERVKADASTMIRTPNGAAAKNDSKGSSLGRTMAGFIDSSLNWEDLKWLRKATKLPIVLKGVQTAEDAVLAADRGVDGIIVGNHGGRSLDTSTPAVLVLLELRMTCPDIFERIDIFLDGGIRRGTDIFKALCLGAKAVGMGRSFLYAANYGPEGVEKLTEIMKDEFETTMRMMGCTDLSQLHPGLLNLYELGRSVVQELPKTARARSKL